MKSCYAPGKKKREIKIFVQSSSISLGANKADNRQGDGAGFIEFTEAGRPATLWSSLRDKFNQLAGF